MNPVSEARQERSSGAWHRLGAAGWAVLVSWAVTWAAQAQTLSKPVLLQLRFEQNLNQQLPLETRFLDDTGAPVMMRQYFGERPVLLMLGYYRCPMLCNLALNGVVESLQEIRATAGKDFTVVFLSIDPRESAALAAAKKRAYVMRYGRPGSEPGWHFLIGRSDQIQAIADAVGFRFAYDREHDQYAHPSGVVVLTPGGKIARYFFGVNYRAKDLSAALSSAAAQQISSRVQELLILCFQHMPLTGRFSASILGTIRVLAALTVIAIAVYVARCIRREKRSGARSAAAGMNDTTA